MYPENKERKRSILIFLILVLIGSLALVIKCQKHSMASTPFEDLKVNVVVCKEAACSLQECQLRDPELRKALGDTIIDRYIDEILQTYNQETLGATARKPVNSEFWLDSLHGNIFLVAKYDFDNDIRALSLAGIKNDSLICINGFRKGSMVPYTFGPLYRKVREIFHDPSVRI
jgi:hypothetical protein